MLILFLSTSFTFAQEDFDEWRLNVNETVAHIFSGRRDCEELAPAHCESPAVTEGQPVSAIIPVATHMNNRLTEERFFEHTASEQFRFLSCDVRQLSAMNEVSERGVALQLDILDELVIKLPTLRNLWAVIEPARKRIEELRNSGPMGGSIRDRAHDDLTRRLIDEQTAILARETDLFNGILGSMWRSDDPLMQDFVLRAVISNKSAEDIRKEALQGSTDRGLVDRVLGRYDEFSLREQVLRPMYEKASSDRNHLMRASMNGHGGGFRPSFMPMDLRQMLVKNSDYSQFLSEAGAQGNREASVFMCQLDRRYVSGAEGVNMIIGASAGVVMGAGSAMGAVALKRIVSGLAPKAVQGLVSRSTTWAMAGLAMGTPIIAEQIKAQCFPSSPQYLLRSGSKVCNENSLENFDEVQREQIQRENCALAVLVVGASSLPYFPYMVKYGAPAFRNYLVNSGVMAALTPARRQRAAQIITQIGGASSVTRNIPQEAPQEESSEEEIVVTGRRRP